MIARLSVYTNVDLALADRVKAWMDTDGAGLYDGLPGYRGSMTLVDREGAQLIGIGFYDSAGHAQEADAVLAQMQATAGESLPEPLRAAAAMRAESVALYEVAHRDDQA